MPPPAPAAPSAELPPNTAAGVATRSAAVGALFLIAALLTFWILPWLGRVFGTEARHQRTDDAYLRGDLTVMGTHVAGYLAELNVTDFQEVRKGQLLARLDDADYRAQVELAQAAVVSHQAAVDNIDSQLKVQRFVLEQARAQVQASQAQYELAKTYLARARNLLSHEAGSQADADRTSTDEKVQAAGLLRARASSSTEQARYAQLLAQKEQAGADLEQAKAQLNLARITLGYTEIRAPADGRVGQRAVFPGQYLSAGTTVLTLMPSTPAYVIANFKETQVRGFKPGLPARVSVDAIPGKTFEAVLADIAPASGATYSLLPADNATGNFTKIVQRLPVKLLVVGQGPELSALRPGLSVQVDVDTEGVVRPMGGAQP
jgi:membrane fusion protein (multidrug efflux system)